MAEVEITLIEAPPKALLGAQVAQFACVTENEPVLDLPVSLSLLRVQRMAVGTLHGYVLLVEFLSLRALLELSALLA